VVTPLLLWSFQSVRLLPLNMNCVDMQPDPALIEKQKQEQMLRKQRAEQIRVRKLSGYRSVIEAQRGGDEEDDPNAGGRPVEADDGAAAVESLG
jgi:hypothetical protein